MMQNKPEHEPIVGDDGELLTDDPTVDVEVYFEYVYGPAPIPPTRWQRISSFASQNKLLTVMLVFVGLVMLSSTLENSKKAAERATFQPQPYPASVPSNMQLQATVVARLMMPAEGETKTLSAAPNVTTVQWSPYGPYLAFNGRSNTLTVWGKELNMFSNRAVGNQSLFDWAPNGQLYVYSPYLSSNTANALSPALFTLDPTRTQPKPMLQQPIPVQGTPKLMVTSARNQTLILAGDGLSFSLIDNNVPRWAITRTLNTPAYDVDWIGEGERFSITSANGIEKWLPMATTAYDMIEGDYQQVAWSGKRMQFAVTQDIRENELHRSSVTVFSSTTGVVWTRPLVLGSKSITSPEAFNTQVAWSTSGDLIATFVEGDTAIDVWDADNGQHLDRLLSDSEVRSVDWSPDGKYLAIGSSDGVTIWSPES